VKIVLTNDDGIDAPGLAALAEVLAGKGQLTIVAPAVAQSGIGHRVTTRSAFRVLAQAPDRFSVEGTPADCARIALKSLVSDADWVIAGINPGANLGSDVYNSGTVAAAREAAVLGCRSIAISQYVARDQAICWEITARHAVSALTLLLGQPLPRGYFWNVNLPHPLAADSTLQYAYCNLDTNPHQYDYRIDGDTYLYQGTIHERPRDAGRDVAQCFGGKVSITRIALETRRFRCPPEPPAL
jgi:5'-nucleotidase